MVAAPDSFWRGRRVFLTGHTGFKGSWLTLWLHHLGAVVHGYALDPPTDPSLFEVAGLTRVLASDTRADIADLDRLRASMTAAQPEIVFHLAAQSLVRESYLHPKDTFATNVIGTVNVLEAVRVVNSVRAVVVVTTDKVYENHEDLDQRFVEDDALGGHDPYSASKAAAEIVAGSYRSSFFGVNAEKDVRIATARAGNVIGGADWSSARLVPDCLRSFARGEPVRLRFPDAVRPWQYVLEPLSGYLRLAERLMGPDGMSFAAAWNFAPDESGDATVLHVAELIAKEWGDGARVEIESGETNPHEARYLRLDATLARTRLGWSPRWSLEQALAHTVSWHRAWLRGEGMLPVCIQQIGLYEKQSPR